MDIKQAIASISDEQWSELAKATGFTVEEAKTHYESFLREIESNPDYLKQSNFNLGEVSEADGGIHASPHWCPISKVCFDFDANFTPGSNWSADLTVSVSVFGKKVWSSDVLHLSSGNSYVHLQPGVAGVLELDFYAGLRGDQHCLYVQGSGKYWAITWHTIGSFDHDLYCFG